MSQDNKKCCCTAAPEFETLSTVNGTYTTTLPKSFKERKGWERPDHRQIFSFIPGTITQVSVKAGDRVAQGDVLLKFNAMKMANKLTAPMAGVIKAVYVNENEAVPNRHLLLEFE
ncbi:MAG: acetyl-CoA carboxylase biotin carboxyl carrier protein subunit [Rikenellaceae bacterium]